MSRKAVVEHIAECKECEQYYSKVINDISINSECSEESKGYVTIAKRIRKRTIITRTITTIMICLVLELLLNYAGGYRFTAKSAALSSGRLNATSELIGNYDWGNWQFYIYNSENSYEVVTVQKRWNGWRAQDNTLVWPKYITDRGGVINAGSFYYWTDTNDKFGIQIFPIIAEDTDVARVSVTVFNKTQTVDVETNKLTILTIENADRSLGNEASGYAYDSEGNILYQLVQSEETMRWMWEKVN